jgi:predicted ATPase
MQTRRNQLSAFDASEGTLYLIFVATLLAHMETPNIFALDNVDGTLNPRLVRALTDHIVAVSRDSAKRGTPKQVFMTSHHPSALDSFDIFDEGQRIFVTDRAGGAEELPDGSTRAAGSTYFRPIKPPENWSKERWTVEHHGKNLSTWLLEGRIKGAL